ncbi:MAG: adenosine-specific kinase [Methanomassiliicoccales archaeon]
MKIDAVPVDKPDDCNIIIGQSHFIKTAEDIYEMMVNAVPGAQFAVAFCEASGPRLVRLEGNDQELRECASRNALRIGAGHSFLLLMRGCYPVNVLRALKEVPEVCTIFCATANQLQVLVGESEQGRGIVGVIDGSPPTGVENDEQLKDRRDFLRKIGYKL